MFKLSSKSRLISRSDRLVFSIMIKLKRNVFDDTVCCFAFNNPGIPLSLSVCDVSFIVESWTLGAISGLYAALQKRATRRRPRRPMTCPCACSVCNTFFRCPVSLFVKSYAYPLVWLCVSLLWNINLTASSWSRVTRPQEFKTKVATNTKHAIKTTTANT